MMNEIDSRIARVKQKLAQVQATWQTRPDEFGVQEHQFRMNPTLSEDALLTFETRHGIRLPEDYRAFLRNVGNGGAGPYYGILPLERWADEWEPDEQGDDVLSQPCPLSETLPSIDKQWKQMLPPGVKNPYQGTLTICEQGCTYFVLLIVSGPTRGRVVYIDLQGQPPYFLREPDFLSWYERWLDETIGGYDLSWFGFRMGGSEADLLHLLHDPHTPGSTRADALSALTKFSQLTAAIPAVLASLQDANANVRKKAALVVARFSIAEAGPFLHELVIDADPTVRESALRALVELPDVPWPMVQQMLQADPDESVRQTAWLKLNHAQKLTIDDVLLMLSSDHPQSRQNAAYSLKNFPGDRTLDALSRCLQDSDMYVRLYGVQSLAALRDRKSVPMLTALLATEGKTLVIGNIIRALTKINDRDAVPALIDATRHPFAGVRYDAAMALGALGDRRAIPALTRLCDDTVQPEDPEAGHFWQDRVCDQARESLQSLE